MSFCASSLALFQSLSCKVMVGIDEVTSKISALGLTIPYKDFEWR